MDWSGSERVGFNGDEGADEMAGDEYTCKNGRLGKEEQVWDNRVLVSVICIGIRL